jgi:glycosyltransferase involved in cell wall biosynthesis
MGAMHRTPRGIDRIDFGFGSFLVDHWPGEVFGVLPMPWGIRAFSRDRMRLGRDRLARMWGEAEAADGDPAFARLLATLAGEPSSALHPQRRHLTAHGIWRLLRILLEGGPQLGEPVMSLPRDAIYLDVGHYGLSNPAHLGWLDARPDIRPVFFLHDAIPLQMPSLVAAETVCTHQQVMANTAHYASAVLVPTESAGESIATELAARGRHDLPIHALSLPIDDIFLTPPSLANELLRHRYFLICGAIEPRKNHELMANVWEELADVMGENTPRLIVAGSPGHASAPILHRLQNTRALAPHVTIVSNLSSPALAQLMAGARAVLMPSLAEGFGLPPVEALALGTPALLSDIGAHRDAAGAYGHYLATNDVAGWRAAIMAMNDDTATRQDWIRHIAEFKSLNWASYMGRVVDVLSRLD